MIEELFGSALARHGLGSRQRFRIVNPQPAQQAATRPLQLMQHRCTVITGQLLFVVYGDTTVGLFTMRLDACSLLRRPAPTGAAASGSQVASAAVEMHPMTNVSNAIIDQLGLRGRFNPGQAGVFTTDQVCSAS